LTSEHVAYYGLPSAAQRHSTAACTWNLHQRLTRLSSPPSSRLITRRRLPLSFWLFPCYDHACPISGAFSAAPQPHCHLTIHVSAVPFEATSPTTIVLSFSTPPQFVDALPGVFDAHPRTANSNPLFRFQCHLRIGCAKSSGHPVNSHFFAPDRRAHDSQAWLEQLEVCTRWSRPGSGGDGDDGSSSVSGLFPSGVKAALSMSPWSCQSYIQSR